MNSNDDVARLWIHEEYNHIMKKIIGGRIFGIPINEDTDLEAIIVAAYFVGTMESSNLGKRIEEI